MDDVVRMKAGKKGEVAEFVPRPVSAQEYARLSKEKRAALTESELEQVTKLSPKVFDKVPKWKTRTT